MPEATARRNRPYAPRLLPEQRREQLLDVVLDVIDTDGVASVSMDAVARRAGVTRPVVYGQFTDANAMLRASLDREEQRAFAQILDAIPAQGDDDLEALTGVVICHWSPLRVKFVVGAPVASIVTTSTAPRSNFSAVLSRRSNVVRLNVSLRYAEIRMTRGWPSTCA